MGVEDLGDVLEVLEATRHYLPFGAGAAGVVVVAGLVGLWTPMLSVACLEDLGRFFVAMRGPLPRARNYVASRYNVILTMGTRAAPGAGEPWRCPLHPNHPIL